MDMGSQTRMTRWGCLQALTTNNNAFAGNKSDVLGAYAAGEILPSGRDSLVAHQALTLQYWLGADALYGIDYDQVSWLVLCVTACG